MEWRVATSPLVSTILPPIPVVPFLPLIRSAVPSHRQTKQAENAGKSATQKKAEQKASKAAKNEKKSFG